MPGPCPGQRSSWHNLACSGNQTSSPPGGVLLTLQWEDILEVASGLRLTICSSKNIWAAPQAVALFLPAAPKEPAFLSLGRLPLTPRELMPQLWDALHVVVVPEVDAFTLHSLHQCTTQACAARGACLDAIKDQGTCSSSTMHAHVPKLASCVVPPEPWPFVLDQLGVPTDYLRPRNGNYSQ